MIKVQITDATTADAALLKQIGATYFYDAYKDVKFDGHLTDYIKTAFIESEIEQQIAGRQAHYMIARNGSNPCGYVKIRWDRTHPNLTTTKNLEVERIYVDRNHWRDGIGKQLLSACIDYGRKNNFEVLWLGVWQKNERAINFYKSQSMEIFGEKKFWVGSEENDDFVLRLSLL